MQIISGLDYTHKLETMVKKCCIDAQNNPFESYIFISEDKEMLEQLFFKYTNYLVNIEIMTWKEFLNQMKMHCHLFKHHTITKTEFTYYLRHILNTEQFYCFNNRQPYPLIQEFIPLIQDYDIYDIQYLQDTFSKEKLKDFMHLYQSLKKQLDEYTYFSLEDMLIHQDLSSLPFHHIYIDADHLYQTKAQTIIEKLSHYYNIICLYTYHPDKRLLSTPYQIFCQNADELTNQLPITNDLFTKTKNKYTVDNYYYFKASSLHQEVKRVVYTIAQQVINNNLQYKDYAIVYTNENYVDLLISAFKELNIPHNLPITTSCQYDYSYKYILDLCNSDEILPLSLIAKKLINDELDKDYKDYLESLYDYHDEMSLSEFKEFFKATYTKNHTEKSNQMDKVHVCTIDKLRLASSRHVFILGMNETILPRLIKDTSLLLDEDIEELRNQNCTSPLTTLEKLGIHQNDILKALIQPFKSLTISYSQQTLSGDTLLESSLYKQLQSLYTFQDLEPLSYLPIDQYYLLGGIDERKTVLNHNIQNYLQSKNQPITLSHQTVSTLYSPTLSVSQIETYNKCPYLYFLQYGLGIYPPKEDKLLPNELGSLIHYVLSICIDDTRDISQLVDQYIKNNDELSLKISMSSVNQYFINQLKKDLEITLIVLRKFLDISSFHVHSKEKKIVNDIHSMTFKGFVDRIDEFENYISIIDYKSSAKDIDLNLAMQGFNIQMLLYLKMITEKYQKDPGAILYFNTKKRILSLDQSLKDQIDEKEFFKQYRYDGYVVDDESHSMIQAIDPHMDKKSDIINVTYVKSRNEYKGHLLTNEQLDILLEKIEEHIYELYQEMMNGRISILPKGSDQNATHTMVNPCHYCSYHSICNFDVFYNEYKLVEFLDVDKILGGEDNAL